jgi:exodeoxyribonuclease VII small subunit
MPEETEIRFEAALGQLEEIVAALERGEPELTAALAKYETGVRLLTQCYSLLERAERAVALLTGVDAQGHPVTAPFDATATVLIEQAALIATSPTAGSGESPTEPATASKPAVKRRAKQATEPEPGVDRFDPPF